MAKHILVIPQFIEELLNDNTITKEDLFDLNKLSSILSLEDLTFYMLYNIKGNVAKQLWTTVFKRNGDLIYREFLEAGESALKYDSDHFNHGDRLEQVFLGSEVEMRKNIFNFLFIDEVNNERLVKLKFYGLCGHTILVKPYQCIHEDDTMEANQTLLNDLCFIINDQLGQPIENTALYVPQ